MRALSRTLVILVVICTANPTKLETSSCDEFFEGFGVYLGSMRHFSYSPPSVLSKVYDKIYNDLGIRYYRTSYESTFSPGPDEYEIVCRNDSAICSWIDIHNEITKYPNISVIASIWSPPHYMKNNETQTLLISEEKNYHYFIRNVTNLIQQQFNITIEKVSPINEPENIFAQWEHTVMTPQQLCSMVRDFNDSLISICPENSYYWVSEVYANTTENATVTCLESCSVFGTHAYALHIGNDPDNFLAYYDLNKYNRKVPGIPIWQTEVSSTFGRSYERQMEEAVDFANNIINFVGHTCIQRYYFWLSYTTGPSGESLIWGDINGGLTLPKKYFTYKHFTLAAFGGTRKVSKCGPPNLPEVSCIVFGQNNHVFVNNLDSNLPDWNQTISCSPTSFCCTTEDHDWDCSGDGYELPSKSICSCRLAY